MSGETKPDAVPGEGVTTPDAAADARDRILQRDRRVFPWDGPCPPQSGTRWVALPETFPGPAQVAMTQRSPDLRPLRALQETPTLGKVFAAIAKARDAADIVLKGSRAHFTTEKGAKVEWRYASADHVMIVARDALAGTGLSVLPIDWRTRRHATENYNVLDRVVRLAHESGEFMDVELLDWPVLPGAGRSFAQALGVALTTSFANYFMRDLLGLPRMESDDMDAEQKRSERRREPEDQTPAPAVADTLSARGRVVVAKLAAMRTMDALRDAGAWWRNMKAGEETAEVRRYTDADVRAIEAKLEELLPICEAAVAQTTPAHGAAADDPAPEEPVAEQVAPPPAAAPASPPGANVAPAPKPAAGTPPAARRRPRGGSGLPGME